MQLRLAFRACCVRHWADLVKVVRGCSLLVSQHFFNLMLVENFLVKIIHSGCLCFLPFAISKIFLIINKHNALFISPSYTSQ